MKKDLENLDFKFWSWFPSGIKDPKRINYFLNQRSKLLDREIIKNSKILICKKILVYLQLEDMEIKKYFPLLILIFQSYKLTQKLKTIQI